MSDVIGLFVEGFAVIGNGFIAVMAGILGLFGLILPDEILRVVFMLFTAAVLWRYARRIPKLIIVLAFVVVASVLVGL